MDGDEPQVPLDDRLARLEARIAALEAAALERTQDRAATVGSATPSTRRAPAELLAADRNPAATGQPRPSPLIQAPVPPTVPASAAASRSLAATFGDLEERLAGRALAVVGGIALVLGAIFFLSLAFSRGWIGPELRVLIGLAAGAIAVGSGAVFLDRGNRLLGHVLTPVGLAIISISLIGATRLYHLVPTEVGLLGALLSAVVVAVIAVRNDSQLVAAFGLISVLLAPPLLEASADTTTLAFIAVTLVGTTGVALWKSWRWLPPIAFVLTVPQAASWILGDPAPLIGLAGIAVLWALNAVAAGGEGLRRRDVLSPSSATVLLGNAAFVVWAGFVVLSDDLEMYRGLFMVIVAAAHFVLGGYVVARDGERNLFGLLALGTGVAALTMAVPIQFDAPAVPIAWTAEAVALAWVAVRRWHPYSAAASAVLFVLAALAVVSLYPWTGPSTAGLPFIDANGGALAFFLAGVAIAVWIVGDRSLRSALATLGFSVAMFCAVSVFTGLALVAAAALLMVAAAATSRWLPLLPTVPIDWQTDGLIPVRLRTVDWRASTALALPAAAVSFGVIAIAHLILVELPLVELGDVTPPAIPFTDEGAAAAAIVIAGVLVAGWLLGGLVERRASVLVAGGVAAYAVVFEVEPWAISVGWVGLAMLAILIARRLSDPSRALPAAAGIVILAAAMVAVDEAARPTRLVVGATPVPVLLTLQAVIALGVVVIGAEVFARSWPEPALRRWTRYGAGVLFVYLLSVVAVDIVGRRAGGSIAFEELRTQGQVALSVLWAILGVAAFMYGIRSKARDIRLAGLALLAVATMKVFLFDLAALDVAYRVISFVVLGIVLLASAWLWQRAQPKAKVEIEPG